MASNAVDSIISQAMDQIALEQIASLNTAHLSDADILPTALESRFRTLKSLPKPKPTTIPKSQTQDQEFNNKICKHELPSSPNASDQKPTSPIHPSLTPTPRRRSGLELSPPDLSPKRRWLCCFGFSLQTRRVKNARKGRGGVIGEGAEWMEEECLGNRETLSIWKERRRKMKKVMEEQDKVCREAEKLFELVKQGSARLDFAATMDEFLSDDDDDHLGFR